MMNFKIFKTIIGQHIIHRSHAMGPYSRGQIERGLIREYDEMTHHV